jgi:hypothetical protein
VRWTPSAEEREPLGSRQGSAIVLFFGSPDEMADLAPSSFLASLKGASSTIHLAGASDVGARQVQFAVGKMAL